ncbi:MAG: alanine racemase [Hydrogenophilus sp.]|nr:alanine racemase [Hydrogenophilus sp.]
MTSRPLLSNPPWPTTSSGELLIAGHPFHRVVERIAAPAFYAYDASRVAERLTTLRQLFAGRYRIFYAVKANPYPPLVAALTRWVDGFDVASIGELTLALDLGVSPPAITWTAPGKTPAAIAQAVAAGVTITIESPTQLAAALCAGERLGIVPHLALRLNPPFTPQRAGMKMAGGPQPFGIDPDQAIPLLQQIIASGAVWVGLHCYAASQLLDPNLIIAQHTAAHAALSRLIDHLGAVPRWLNLGGGWGIPYHSGDSPLSLPPLVESLLSLADQHHQRYPDTHLILELGRYLVGEAGLFAAQIIDRKTSYGETLLILASGLNAHLAATGNLGQILKRPYPILLAHRATAPPEEEVTIVGPLCTPLDTFAKRLPLPRSAIGDWLIILQSGAYGASASPQRFLSHPPIPEALIWPSSPSPALC